MSALKMVQEQLAFLHAFLESKTKNKVNKLHNLNEGLFVGTK